jgi:hypothetical protein
MESNEKPTKKKEGRKLKRKEGKCVAADRCRRTGQKLLTEG